MEWKTTLPDIEWTTHLEKDWAYLLMGSCFTQHMSQFLWQRKVSCLSNPFGNVYNPISLSRQLSILWGEMDFLSSFAQHRMGHYFSWDFHSDLWASSQSDLQNQITKIQEKFQLWQSEDRSKVVILTLGTAWVYRLISSNHFVANCHGMPNTLFQKELLSLDEIEKALKKLVHQWFEQCPSLSQIIFTVSPVRYLRDGFVENQRSKARLIMAIESLLSDSRLAYFPAYEIFMDDLRDYRYYSEDLVHPNEMGVKYVTSFFKNQCFSKQSLMYFEAIERLNKAKQHRFKDVKNEESQQFILKQIDRIQELSQKYPGIHFEDDLAYFSELLIQP